MNPPHLRDSLIAKARGKRGRDGEIRTPTSCSPNLKNGGIGVLTGAKFRIRHVEAELILELLFNDPLIHPEVVAHRSDLIRGDDIVLDDPEKLTSPSGRSSQLCSERSLGLLKSCSGTGRSATNGSRDTRSTDSSRRSERTRTALPVSRATRDDSRKPADVVEQGDIIQDRNTTSGISDADQWRCQHEMAILAPERMVHDIDIDTGRRHAAGERGLGSWSSRLRGRSNS